MRFHNERLTGAFSTGSLIMTARCAKEVAITAPTLTTMDRSNWRSSR